MGIGQLKELMIQEWFINASIIVGLIALVVGYVVGYIPAASKFVAYKTIGVLLGALLLGVGIYSKGSYDSDMKWKLEIANLETRLARAEGEAKTATAKVEYVYVDKIQKVTETKVVIQEKIRNVATEIDQQCKVSPKAVELLNAAAVNSVEGLK